MIANYQRSYGIVGPKTIELVWVSAYDNMELNGSAGVAVKFREYTLYAVNNHDKMVFTFTICMNNTI